jgi:hypothetical protein
MWPRSTAPRSTSSKPPSERSKPRESGSAGAACRASFPAGVVPMPAQIGCLDGHSNCVAHAWRNLATTAATDIGLARFVGLHSSYLTRLIPPVVGHRLLSPRWPRAPTTRRAGAPRPRTHSRSDGVGDGAKGRIPWRQYGALYVRTADQRAVVDDGPLGIRPHSHSVFGQWTPRRSRGCRRNPESSAGARPRCVRRRLQQLSRCQWWR